MILAALNRSDRHRAFQTFWVEAKVVEIKPYFKPTIRTDQRGVPYTDGYNHENHYVLQLIDGKHSWLRLTNDNLYAGEGAWLSLLYADGNPTSNLLLGVKNQNNGEVVILDDAIVRRYAVSTMILPGLLFILMATLTITLIISLHLTGLGDILVFAPMFAGFAYIAQRLINPARQERHRIKGLLDERILFDDL